VIPRRRSLGGASAGRLVLVVRLVFIVLVASLGGLAGGGCKNSAGQRQTAPSAPGEAAPATVVVDTGERKVTFHVELARTEPEREKGLMYRERLAPDAGMLFLFERPSVQTFWMKNTLIPLDMVFIASDLSVVGVVANAQPLTLTARSVGEPSQYVLEIGGGLAARLGIRAGGRVQIQGIGP
jgi:uncharacterized membrane protein (UPF0127 family)